MAFSRSIRLFQERTRRRGINKEIPSFGRRCLFRPSTLFAPIVLVVGSTFHSMTTTTKVDGLANPVPVVSKPVPYEPPSWTIDILENAPANGRLHLANLPTPLYKIQKSASASSYVVSPSSSSKPVLQLLDELDISLYIKRDDMTGGVETGGNKIRKLEFLLAEALVEGYDSVVTIGGEQSNHCRATAAACRMVGLEPHLILRTKKPKLIRTGDGKAEVTGNILFDRMVGSTIYTCTPGEYGRVGSNELIDRVCTHIESKAKDRSSSSNRRPYAIPVGGSSGLGSWGYINGVNEVMEQWTDMRNDDGSVPSLDHVVFATGSGGTAAGICLGMALARRTKPQVHAIGVCDNPDYFYDYVSEIADDMGLVLPNYMTTNEYIRQHLNVHQGKGLGYASSTKEELDFISNFALETGIVLDPVYSGKALYHFINEVLTNEDDRFRGKNILFWHTGGALGMYDKVDNEMLAKLDISSPVFKLDVYGKKEKGGDDDNVDDKTIPI